MKPSHTLSLPVVLGDSPGKGCWWQCSFHLGDVEGLAYLGISLPMATALTVGGADGPGWLVTASPCCGGWVARGREAGY